MRLKVFGVRLEICWDEEPDAEAVQDPTWLKSTGDDKKDAAYERIVTTAKHTGLYL